MNWMWWTGGGIAAAAVLVVILYAVGLGGLAKVFRSIMGGLGDWASSTRQWLNKPGNRTRGACAVFAVMFLVAGLQSWQRGTVIIQQRSDYVRLERDRKADADEFERQRKGLLSDLERRDEAVATFTALAARAKQALAEAQRASAAANAQAAADRKRAAASEAKYQAAFELRPPECKVALEVMAQACPTLTDY